MRGACVTSIESDDYRVWVEAKDAVVNVAIVGSYRVKRLAGDLIYLPLMVRNWDHRLAALKNRLHLPMIVK